MKTKQAEQHNNVVPPVFVWMNIEIQRGFPAFDRFYSTNLELDGLHLAGVWEGSYSFPFHPVQPGKAN